ncbi:MAG: hypothetical protein ACRDEA_12330, partial [Microcystaceae cyanobacterium]
GLDPYAPDSDGDRVPDGSEVAHGSRPGRKDNKKQDSAREAIRDRYFKTACSVLGWQTQGLSYETLYEDIGGNASMGKALDKKVFEKTVQSGQPPIEAAYLLAQSPYLQFLKDRGLLGVEEMVGYAKRMLDAYEQKQQETEEREIRTEDSEEQELEP